MASQPSSSEKEIPTITIDSDEDSSSSVILVSTESSSYTESEPDTDSSVQSLKYTCGTICAIKARESTSANWKKSILENFSSALVSVQNKETSWPLFSSNVADVFSTFSQLSNDAQSLYVGLLSAKHIWQRKKTFQTENDNELADEIAVMEREGLIRTDYSTESIEVLLRLLSAAEIRAICRNLRMKSSGSRKSLINAVLQNNVAETTELRLRLERRINHHLGDMLKLTDAPRDCMLNILILQSLPHSLLLTKDGRSPILSVMNMVTEKSVVYPDYSISPAAPIYHSRNHFLRSVDAMKLNGKIRYSIYKKRRTQFSENFNEALHAFQCILEDNQTRMRDDELPKCLRQFTAGSILADALLNSMDGLKMIEKHEQMVIGYQTLLGQVTYKSNERGLWYDQLAAAHISSQDMPSAIDVLIDALLDNSLDPVYRVLLSNRALKVTQFQYSSLIMVEQVQMLESMLSDVKSPPRVIINAKSIRGNGRGSHRMSYYLESDAGSGPTFSSLEQVVLYRYRKLGFDHGLISGDTLSMSVFGTFFWDIIYSMEVPNAFICQYQREPIDLGTGDFYSNREGAIQKRLTEMTEKWTLQEINDFVDAAWKAEGRESLVSWRKFGGKQKFKQIMECIGLKIISTICLRLSKEYPVARFGFPSIMVWNTNTKVVKFFTMKDANLPISPFETGWLAKLDVAGADVSLVQVDVAPPNDVAQDSSSDDDSPPRKQPRFGEGSKTT